MKHGLLNTLGLIVFVMVAFVTVPAEAQTTLPGPYYPTPSWDQKLKCDTKATCPRFILLSKWGSDAVLDLETGLVWERTPDKTTFHWGEAQWHCNNLILDGRRGFRVPTIQDLASLLDLSVKSSDLKLPAGHPFQNVNPKFYWSATTFHRTIGGRVLAWGVDFGDGNLYCTEKEEEDGGEKRFVWCVRGGQGVDPQ